MKICKKLFLLLSLCLFSISSFAQPSKGTITLSGDYTLAKQENISAFQAGFFGIEYFVLNKLSLGVGTSYFDGWRGGVQANVFLPTPNNKVYLSILNYASVSLKGDLQPSLSITPAFNYDFYGGWTVFAGISTFEVGIKPNYYNLTLNIPRLGFLYSF